jgi:hypothetical protein
MNYLKPLKINEIDFNKIHYSKIKENQNKKIILIKYKLNNNKLTNFVFQTPTLKNITKPIVYNDYKELDILLESKNKNINSFYEFIDNLENNIKNHAKIYASKWFNNNNNETVNFQKIIRDNNTFKIKIVKNNDFETLVQINNEINIDYDKIEESIPENCWCKMLLEVYAIWINSNHDFGIFLRPILISFTLQNIYNYNFIEDSESESEKECDIPDTEISNNLFIKNKHKDNNFSNLETSQLECNILYNTLMENNNNSQPILLENNNDNTSDNNLSLLENNDSVSSKNSGSLESLNHLDSSSN